MSIKYGSNGSCSFCTEHCDDYLLLLQELLEADAAIEELQWEVAFLRDQLHEHDAE